MYVYTSTYSLVDRTWLLEARVALRVMFSMEICPLVTFDTIRDVKSTCSSPDREYRADTQRRKLQHRRNTAFLLSSTSDAPSTTDDKFARLLNGRDRIFYHTYHTRSLVRCDRRFSRCGKIAASWISRFYIGTRASCFTLLTLCVLTGSVRPKTE